MRVPAALLAACLLAACGAAVPQAEPSPSPSPIETVAPEMVEAAATRQSFGLRSDIEWVIAVSQHPDSVMSELGILVTPEEDVELRRRFANQDRLGPLQEYGAAHPETFAGMYIDQPGGGVVILMFTDDLDQHRRALEAITPPGVPVQVRAARHTEAELIRLMETIDAEALRDEGYELNSLSLDTINNVVRIDAKSDLPNAKARLEGRFGGVVVADISPLPGPWQNRGAGTGWRLLAAGRTDASEAYVVHAATDESELAALWARLALTDQPPPEVDFGSEMVAVFGHGIGSSCPEVRLDDVVIDADAAVVYSVTSDPLGPRACTADLAGAAVFVVVLDRAALPASPFSLQIREEIFDCEGCTERIEVDLDD